MMSLIKHTMRKSKNIKHQMNNNKMRKITVIKIALTLMHIKTITLSNQSFCQFVHCLTANYYFVEVH